MYAERLGQFAEPEGDFAPPVDASLVASIAKRRYERSLTVLEAVMQDRDVTSRLGCAGVIVRIDVRDVPGASLTLMLDRQPARFCLGPAFQDAPDVTLTMLSGDLEALFREGEHLPLQILAGKVTFEGRVRKFLGVLPLLRQAALDLAVPPTGNASATREDGQTPLSPGA